MYQSVTIEAKSKKVTNIWTSSLHVTLGVLPVPVPQVVWGIDPGINFGLTVIDGSKVFIFHGRLNRDDKPGRMALVAYRFLQSMTAQFDPGGLMTIEGASYGDFYGQVLLSEVRTGFYMAAALPGSRVAHVEIVAPKMVRKRVFGSGDIKAPDEWPLLNKNAADALAMALHAAQYMKGD